MRGPVEGGCGVLGLGSIWHQFFEDREQCCCGGQAVPGAMWEGLMIRVLARGVTPLYSNQCPAALPKPGAKHQGRLSW